MYFTGPWWDVHITHNTVTLLAAFGTPTAQCDLGVVVHRHLLWLPPLYGSYGILRTGTDIMDQYAMEGRKCGCIFLQAPLTLANVFSARSSK